MIKGFRLSFLVGMVLLAVLGTADAASSDMEMLRKLFGSPRQEWKEQLAQHQPLLDDQFFAKVSQRISWSLENNHKDDAIRFALVGDLGSQVVSRQANYRLELAHRFVAAKDVEGAMSALEHVSAQDATKAQVAEAERLRAELQKTAR